MSLDKYTFSSFPHGGGVEVAAKAWQCEATDVLDLSTGLHPAGAPVWLPQWLQEHADLVAHYPEVTGEPARSALAMALGVKPENVWITAGAQAVIEVIFQAMGWSSLAIEVPCYNEPIRCAQRVKCRLQTFEAGDSIPAAEALWLTSPSNPFGAVQAFPQGYAGVLDESYMPFGQRRILGVVDKVIRLGSLTKTFCIPGLRLGYVVAESRLIQQINAWLPPWPASTLALHLLPRLLPEADQRDAQIVVARNRMTNLLQSFDWHVLPSTGSFVLAKHNMAMPDFAKQQIIVRVFPEWPQLEGWVRFGLPGDERAWQRLENALCQ